MTQEHDFTDEKDLYSREFWDDRYAATEALWSGSPNPHLVAQVAELTPGTALDVGSGEGADAIWLAARGWQVTGLDISQVALDRAGAHADQAGAEIAKRITWQQGDLLSWIPTEQFDLVTAHFIHLPGPARRSLHRSLAAAVRPGGSLLVVGHHPEDLKAHVGRPDLPDFFFTAEEVAAELDPGQWEVVVAAAPQRQIVDSEGKPVTISDAVLRAVRLRAG
jgi:2-polyprenyl-3-methyl-5-hydroxy-6-metoxy-1,4-benzoquinol methylase